VFTHTDDAVTAVRLTKVCIRPWDDILAASMLATCRSMVHDHCGVTVQAQNAQTDLIRELDDTKRELELTVEKRLC
jgi:hypothetical protein